MEFIYETQPLKDASRYISPCITGTAGIPKALLTALKEKVTATYYPLSKNKTGVFVTNFSKTSAAKNVLSSNYKITEYRYANISDSSICFDSCYIYLVIERKNK